MSNAAVQQASPSSAKALDYEVIIVGAGFGGMGAAIQLKRMGIDRVLILDREDDVGGTWHMNTYPGIAVDIASTTYCYSFEPNPRWKRLYAKGDELKAYALHVAQKYDLRRSMRFRSTVERASYDEAARTWTVVLSDGQSFSARVLVLATGFLAQPKLPDIAGLASFRGKTIHTARWDHDYDLSGKRVAVIGTGATSVQLLPEIATKVQQLDVYQRTPIWVVPKVDLKIPGAVQALFEKLPLAQRMVRFTTSSILEVIMVVGALHYGQFWFFTHILEWFCRQFLAFQVRDSALQEKLTPSYSFGCKRPTFSNDYFPTFTRKNVELVTDGIVRVESDGIVTRDGRKRDIDVLILATGYKVWERGNFPPFPVHGRQGVELGDYWEENGFQSYEGITLHGFPNFFYYASPYAFTGLSYFFAIEAQMRHMARALGAMQEARANEVEVRAPAQASFVASMRKRLRSTVFSAGNCATSNSYYFNQHGESPLLRPTPTASALWSAGHYPIEDYELRS
ncbi:MAG: NAD(P)/FAD-dependent oxidoreductase [Myxococcales bacterium]